MSFHAYILVGVILLSLDIQGQENNVLSEESLFFQSIRANQDESYITFGQGIGNLEPLIFEAKINPYFLLRTKDNSKWGATLSTNILLRMYAEESLPVRSPSYMPNVVFYRQIDQDTERNNYLFLKISHHSNGQEGNFYNEDGSVNLYKGSFSTDYFEFGVLFNEKKSLINNCQKYFRTSFEYHFNIDRSPELEGIYSFYRWNNAFRIFRFPVGRDNQYIQSKIETAWLFGNLKDVNAFDFSKRFNFSMTINYHPKVLTDVSLFANFYSGMDYYNMHFTRRLNVFRIGIQAFTLK
jgi:hypothetical protein